MLKTDRQTDRQTPMKTLPPTTADGVGKQLMGSQLSLMYEKYVRKSKNNQKTCRPNET